MSHGARGHSVPAQLRAPGPHPSPGLVEDATCQLCWLLGLERCVDWEVAAGNGVLVPGCGNYLCKESSPPQCTVCFPGFCGDPASNTTSLSLGACCTHCLWKSQGRSSPWRPLLLSAFPPSPKCDRSGALRPPLLAELCLCVARCVLDLCRAGCTAVTHPVSGALVVEGEVGCGRGVSACAQWAGKGPQCQPPPARCTLPSPGPLYLPQPHPKAGSVWGGKCWNLLSPHCCFPRPNPGETAMGSVPAWAGRAPAANAGCVAWAQGRSSPWLQTQPLCASSAFLLREKHLFSP